MIVVTAPTGNIGHQVVQNLLDSGEPVRVIVRDPDRIPTPVRQQVEIVQGSHGDPTVVEQAFTGADAVFWLFPSDPYATNATAAALDFTRPACEAFVSHEVKRVIDITALGRGTPMAAHAGLVTVSLAMDDLIASTGVNFRALTMSSFMDNILWQAAPIKTQGAFYMPLPGDHRHPAVATRDIAAVATRLLRDDTWTGQGHVAVLGPEDISFDEMAQIMSETLMKPVRYQQITGDAYKATLLRNGWSDEMAQANLDMMLAKAAGLDNAEPRTPASTTPTSFRQWCEEVLKPAVLGE